MEEATVDVAVGEFFHDSCAHSTVVISHVGRNVQVRELHFQTTENFSVCFGLFDAHEDSSNQSNLKGMNLHVRINAADARQDIAGRYSEKQTI